MKFFKLSHILERNHFTVPNSVQKSIPIKRIYKDGIFFTGGKFSKTWRFLILIIGWHTLEKQMEMFLAYCAVLNALPVDAGIKITLFNRQLNQKEFNQSLLLQMQGDGLDSYRAEYNDILVDKAADSNNLIQEKYITISVEKKKC